MSAISGRRAAAVLAAKLVSLASRALGRGGGTALPGVVAGRIDPLVIRDLSRQLTAGSITVSGTNGKTTTSRFLAAILSDAGYTPIRNDSGSNLMRGVATSLVDRATVLGNLGAGDLTVGLFEVDEAALPGVAAALAPQRVVLLNLFRDQLDRYGEVATIARLWSETLHTLAPTDALVVNADDPLLADTVEGCHQPVSYFGIEMASSGADRLEHASDVKACPRCEGPIHYSAIYLGHLGQYACGKCDFTRPQPTITASDIFLSGVSGCRFTLEFDGQSADVSLRLPGMYNVYNALAAAAAASTFGISLPEIAASLKRTTPAFGRMESIAIGGRQVVLALAKNPAGLNEVLRTVGPHEEALDLMVMLNDNAADGRDVSWVWDADIEMLAGKVRSVVFSGTRAPEMALRFKYAGVLGSHSEAPWAIIEDIAGAFDRALAWTAAGGTLFIIPTYTAMLDVRAILARRGHVRPYWEG